MEGGRGEISHRLIVGEEEMQQIALWETSANPPQRRDYIFRNGNRYVRPYHFEFISDTKKRWIGKKIIDLFTDEFKGRDRDYYVSALKSGQIKVDGCIVPVSYIVQPSQRISHCLHRHEPPVMALNVSILQKEPDVLTVCKPASIPVHPCGQYRKNTILGILEAEHDLAPLFHYISAIHRLDRLVSGLLILARSASKAEFFRKQIELGVVQKQYIAKVIGIFPEDEQIVNVSVFFNHREGRSIVEEPSDICVTGEIPTKGKASCTKFTRISTNGVHSIVLCKPITGRSHQIRIHLKYMGHPIANDLLYLSDTVADGSTRVYSNHRSLFSASLLLEANPNDNCSGELEDNSDEDFSIDPTCTNCPNLGLKGYDGSEEGLWLHSVRYSGPDWVYECPYPEWATLT